MSRYVTVTSLGTTLLDTSASTPEQALGAMQEHWQREIDEVLSDKPDLIVLPEACDRFQNHSTEQRQAYYACRGNRMRDFFAEAARRNRCYIAYSAVRQMEDGSFRNSTQIFDRNGEIAGIYNKNHIVIEENTVYGILGGKSAPLIECDFGTLGCAICFDLNFDPILRKYEQSRPDMLLFSSMYHGGLMQNYWAYRLRTHFIGSVCNLPCTIISPVGHVIATGTNYFKRVTATINLDCRVCHLDYNEEEFQAAKDKYGRGLALFNPGYLGSILLTSEMEDRSIEDIIAEFDIEILDDYFKRVLAFQETCVEP